MKLQLDFDNKIIRTEERVNLGNFFSKLEEILPDLKWREFDLEVGSITNWINPIPYPVYPAPYDITPCPPWIVTYDTAGDPIVDKSGIYNINIT